MRGRRARPLDIVSADVPILQHVARSRSQPWFQVQHARILLAVSAGQRIQSVAVQMQCHETTIWRLCRRYEQQGLPGVFREAGARGDRSGFPPLQCAQIVKLACLEPVAKGLHITHWTSHDLARQAMGDGIVKSISPRTVRQILHDVDLQPHRTRYWKTFSSGCRIQGPSGESAVVLRKCREFGLPGRMGGLRR